MQRSSSDWPDPESGEEEEAVDRGAVVVSTDSDIRGGAVGRELRVDGDKREKPLREEQGRRCEVLGVWH